MEVRSRKNRSVALMNNKGGVGKTTTAFYIAKNFQRKGRTVICIDFDQQAQISGLMPEITRDNVKAEDIIDIDSDYVVVDTGPEFKMEHIDLMDVCDLILVPFTLESLEMEQTLKLLKTISRTGNIEKCKLIVFHSGTNTILYKNLMPTIESLAEQLGAEILFVMRKSQAVPQGLMEKKTVFEITSSPEVRNTYKELLKSVTETLIELAPIGIAPEDMLSKKGGEECQARH